MLFRSDLKGVSLKGDIKLEQALITKDKLLERAEKIISGQIHPEPIHMRAKFTKEDIARDNLEEALNGYIQAATEIQRLRQGFGKETKWLRSLSEAVANRMRKVVTLMAQLAARQLHIVEIIETITAAKIKRAEQAESKGRYTEAIEIYFDLLVEGYRVAFQPADRIRKYVRS